MQTPIEILVRYLKDGGFSKFEVTPSGGSSAGVGVAILPTAQGIYTDALIAGASCFNASSLSLDGHSSSSGTMVGHSTNNQTLNLSFQ